MLKVGIVGLPNVGKSTLFNAVLKREQALSANYPFATIEPNIGVIDVLDERLDKLAELVLKETKVNPPKVYASIEFVDIAGLVKGASKGEGLGNQFLANIREVDLILQVVRDFSDTNIIREHSKNPDDDSDTINSELLIKDIETVERKLHTIGNDPKRVKEIAIFKKFMDGMSQEKFAIDIRAEVDENDYLLYIKPLYLLTDKDMVYVFNVDETDDRLKHDYTESDTYKNKPVIYINAKLESELSALSKADQLEYLGDLGIKTAGLDKITKMSFEKLGLISYLTAGEKEVRAWEIKKGINAQLAAGRIHTDFIKKFVKAEVIAFDDYTQYGTRVACREAGKLRMEGRDYIVKDGDVIEFKIGA